MALNPDWIIICPCGLDMAETLRELPPLTSSGFWPELKAVQEGRVVLVDGNQMFNRCAGCCAGDSCVGFRLCSTQACVS